MFFPFSLFTTPSIYFLFRYIAKKCKIVILRILYFCLNYYIIIVTAIKNYNVVSFTLAENTICC